MILRPVNVKKRGLRRKYLYFCLIYILRHLLSNQAFGCSGMIWPDIVAVSRPLFFFFFFFFSGLGVIPKVFEIHDALYRPQYFAFEALLKAQ